ncbi:hypothetical protein PIB30_046529 [Stylosanthes scabra]|uniref:Retrotransposon Copia-like N-terminal domain-containing protein n=1 Tax=Stylosanthes scabra TaxID=79078 RepID=A0ABU6RGI4_9FABA|nr:hypothetical protein [Stylosanthes scabra]
MQFLNWQCQNKLIDYIPPKPPNFISDGGDELRSSLAHEFSNMIPGYGDERLAQPPIPKQNFMDLILLARSIISLFLTASKEPSFLSHKLDEDNYSTWKKSVLLTIRTLKLQDHLLLDKAPPQFVAVSSSDADSAKKGAEEAPSGGVNKKYSSSGSTLLQESEKFLKW